jgi:hypothetical protein
LLAMYSLSQPRPEHLPMVPLSLSIPPPFSPFSPLLAVTHLAEADLTMPWDSTTFRESPALIGCCPHTILWSTCFILVHLSHSSSYAALWSMCLTVVYLLHSGI